MRTTPCSRTRRSSSRAIAFAAIGTDVEPSHARTLVYALPGHTVMPGMFDAHGHYGSPISDVERHRAAPVRPRGQPGLRRDDDVRRVRHDPEGLLGLGHAAQGRPRRPAHLLSRRSDLRHQVPLEDAPPDPLSRRCARARALSTRTTALQRSRTTPTTRALPASSWPPPVANSS